MKIFSNFVSFSESPNFIREVRAEKPKSKFAVLQEANPIISPLKATGWIVIY